MLPITGNEPIRLIVSDVDGTLVKDDKSISQETVSAVQASIDSGIRVVVATGRAWNEVQSVVKAIPALQYYICANGALVMDVHKGEPIFHENLSKNHMNALLDTLLPLGVLTEAYVMGTIYAQLGPTLSLQELLHDNIYHEVLATRTFVDDLRNTLNTLDEGPEKIQTFYGTNAIYSEILERLPGADWYVPIPSAEGNIEFIQPHLSKGHAVASISEQFGIQKASIMCVGDSNNDISMLSYCEHAVAMGNANDQVKTIANYITHTNDDDGLAYAIRSAMAYNKQFR